MTTNILPNMKNMGLIDHDLGKFPELDMSQYMKTIRETKDGTLHLVPMEWDGGLHKSELLSLMHMPHFDRTTEVNTCVKKMLVYFYGGFLWLDR